MPFGVTFQYHNQKSTSSKFNVLSRSCLMAGGHAALLINQGCIMLVNSFAIPDGIMNRVGWEALACAFSCFRACDIIVCSSGVCLVPFFALAITYYSTLYEKQTLFICIYLYEIGTGPITYLISTYWRWTPIPMLSHRCIYLTHHKELIQYTHKFLSFILNKNKRNLTIKIISCALQGCIQSPSLPWLLAECP